MSRSLHKTWAQFKESRNCLAGGSSTNSKIPQFEDAEPALIVRGEGRRVWDLDGNEYIDYRNALGPVTVEYAVPQIDSAVIEQIRHGVIYGHAHPLEGEAARMLTHMIPCAERVRFLKTGGEAVAACIKIARSATDRNRVIHCGYNGWLTNVARPRGHRPRGVAASQPHRGVPRAVSELHMSLPWGDVAEWERVFAE